jgi:uncharacterized protein YukJ
MPLKNYGVLKGSPTNYRNSWLANNHYQIKIQANNDFFRIAANVRSKDNPHDLFYKIIDGFSHPMLQKIKTFGVGFTELPNTPNSGALDYVRGNMFDIATMKLIPEQQTGKNNDLNDLFDFYIQKAIKEKALVYAFGQRWFPLKAGAKDKYFPEIPDQGIHDIHMNQGNPKSGGFGQDNGVWQDGGMLIYYPATNNWVGAFFRFQSQAIVTDATTGHPALVEIGTALAQGSVKIIAALVNPKGKEAKNEKILLFNTSDAPISLSGWSLQNGAEREEKLSGTLQSGEPLVITLQNMPLSNEGSTISLMANGVKIDGVSYTSEQAQQEGHWVVF